MAVGLLNRRFLVVSLGNPGAHYETLHSAGHVVLNALPAPLHDQPAFTSQRIGKKPTLASLGPKYLMLQSPTVMNVSGPWVGKAWKDILAEHHLRASDLSLVLVHDDLEEDLGVVKIRQWSRSHRGHNGVKSVNGSLQPASYGGSSRWARISVGIGRPAARDHATVADFVLRPLTRQQKAMLQDQSAPAVLEALMQLEAQWADEAPSQ